MRVQDTGNPELILKNGNLHFRAFRKLMGQEWVLGNFPGCCLLPQPIVYRVNVPTNCFWSHRHIRIFVTLIVLL